MNGFAAAALAAERSPSLGADSTTRPAPGDASHLPVRTLIMDSVSHYLEAELLLRRADALSPSAAEQHAPLLLQEAQVHATLALAAISALSQGFDGPPLRDYDAWVKAASVEAPIPTETDGEYDAIRVGDLSPTGDMDSRELAAWLRRVPLGAVLEDIDGDRWYRITGATGDPIRLFPAICPAREAGLDNIDDHDDIMHAQQFAPFTLLALSTPAEGGE